MDQDKNKWQKAYIVLKHCGLIKAKAFLVLIFYYIISLVNALFDGLSMVLLANLITGKVNAKSNSSIIEFITGFLTRFSFPTSYEALYFFLIGLFLLRIIIFYIYTALDGYLEANLRKRIQERGFKSILSGDWEFLRNIRVGERVGAITEESTNVAHFFMAIVRAIYDLLFTLVLAGMAVLINFEVTLLFALVGIPLLLVLKHLFSQQAKIVEQLVAQRQKLYGTVTERVNNLFQIKVEANIIRHKKQASEVQDQLTKLEIKWWYLRAGIYAFNLLIPVVALYAFHMWAVFKGQSLKDVIYILAGVGIIGGRALTQFNQLVSNIGNITAYLGSIHPVYNLFMIPKEAVKKLIAEKIQAVELEKVSYQFGDNEVVKDISLKVEIGSPLVIVGPSGSGKTTLANIIAGIYCPNKGNSFYIGTTGKKYNTNLFRPKVGYITQDIQLFQGTIKDNLIISFDSHVDDQTLWDSLRRAGAEKFVRELGGLEGEIVEAGRSLSGGEKRRLGMARVLTNDPDILILDEVSVGLDGEIKKELIETIIELSRSLVVIIITHDTDVAGISENIFKLKG